MENNKKPSSYNTSSSHKKTATSSYADNSHKKANYGKPPLKKEYSDKPYAKKAYGDEAETGRTHKKVNYGKPPLKKEYSDKPYAKKAYGDEAETGRTHKKANYDKPFFKKEYSDKPYEKKPYTSEEHNQKIITEGSEMVKQVWQPFPVLAPVPAVLVTSKYKEKDNIMTVGWTGIICSKPPMLYISVREERFSYDMIEKSGEFVVNLTNKKLARATDFCGVRCGKNIDKFKECNLKRQQSITVEAPAICESPINLECKVCDSVKLGSHTMFIANITSVSVDESLIDKKGKLDLKKADLISYVHGGYYQLGAFIDVFGYSVRKKPLPRKSYKKNK